MAQLRKGSTIGGYPILHQGAPIIAQSGVIVGDFTVQGNLTVGDSNQDVFFQKALLVAIDDRNLTFGYNGDGTIQSVTEKDGATVVKTSTFTYNADGTINTVTAIAGGKTVVTTFGYNGDGTINTVTKTVS